MKILVVEDEIKLADYLAKGLAEEGFVVDVAHNGVDGLHLASELDYDLIVLDGMLPGIDGLFDRFYRAEAARTHAGSNHGLGLAIVSAIARMHSGETFAESMNGQTRIGLLLPVG